MYWPPCWRTKEVLQHGDPILGSVILCGTFQRISQLWENAHTLNLANCLLYLYRLQYLKFFDLIRMHGFRFYFLLCDTCTHSIGRRLRTFASKFFKALIKLWKFYQSKLMRLVMSSLCKIIGGSPGLRFRENMPGSPAEIWENRALLAKKTAVATSPKILRLELWSEVFSAGIWFKCPL